MAITHFQIFVDAFAALDQGSRQLAGDEVLCPPIEDYGYQSTPRNSLTFAAMGVDGVHYAILKIDGQVRDDSPVVYVSPMDSRDVAILAKSFLAFLADGCGVPLKKMQAVLNAERSSKRELVQFLSKHFDLDRLLGEERTEPLTVKYGHLIHRKPDCP